MSIRDMFAPKLTPEEVSEVWLWANGEGEISSNVEEKLYDLLVDEMPYGVAKARTGDPLQWMQDYLYQLGGSRLKYWLKSNSTEHSMVGETYPAEENEVSKKSKPITYPCVYKNYRNLGTSKKTSLDKVMVKSTGKDKKMYGSRSIIQRDLGEGTIRVRDVISGKVRSLVPGNSKNVISDSSSNLQVAVKMLNEQEENQQNKELEAAKKIAASALLAWRQEATKYAAQVKDGGTANKAKLDALRNKMETAKKKIVDVKKKIAEKRVQETVEGQAVILSTKRLLKQIKESENSDVHLTATLVKERAKYRRMVNTIVEQIDPPKIKLTRIEEKTDDESN